MQVERIHIIPNKRQKYVLIQTEQGMMVRGNPDIQWHKDIVDQIEVADTQAVQVLGGGWLLQNTQENTIYLWGKSDRYGEAPLDIVRELVKKQFPNATLKLEEAPV